MIFRLILFLAVNFAGLALGARFTGTGVPSTWYTELDKAPWTPPGWVFGAAWTFIMICFAIYMAYAWKRVEDKKTLLVLFGIQWILNFAWNPVFFLWQNPLAGFIVITLLTLLIGYMIISYHPALRTRSALLAPYFIWLVIATSLNGYILIYN